MPAAATVLVDARRDEAAGVVSLELVAPDGRRLPDWEPGAHVDLVLPDGTTRQYSLCGDRWDAHRYRIGVLREPDGRGGSAYVHDRLAVGDAVGLGGPRNNFPLVPAGRYLFVAGGIGITPILAMIHTADVLGADWQLLYGGRTAASMAFRDELARHGDRVRFVPQDEHGLLDLAGFLGAPREDTRVYACGPPPLLAALAEVTAGWPSHAVRTERFTARDDDAPARDTAFDVELARRGTTVTVTPDRTVLQAVADAGVDVLSSCRQGVCGTCETPVLAGEPDHRDSILDDDERGRRLHVHLRVPVTRRPIGARPVITIPATDVDPFATEVLTDPLGFQEWMRDAGPVIHLDRYDVVALPRYAQVHAALVDWQSFRSGAGVGLSNFATDEPWRPPSLLLETDPPGHDAPRRVLSTVLGPRALRSLQERWAADAESLVDDLLAAGPEFDAVASIGEAFPLRVFPDAVGLPDEGRENLLPYGNMLFNAFGPHNELVERVLPRMGELSAWVNARCARDALAPGGFGAAIWAAADRGDLTPEQAPLVVRSLLSAGVDTTVTGISAVLYAFATHPDQWARLRDDPELARVAFDEAVRWESPVQTFFRTTTRDVEIAGVDVPEGRKVLMFLGSANRDPRHWGDDADRFDLARDPSGHVGFGMGMHQCVGQHVARMEAVSVLRALAARVRTIELAGDPVRRPNNTMRAWESMPVRVS